MHREIAIISGKGGTGKTTLALSILPFLKNIAIADCDVDAPDMKVLLNDKVEAKSDFIGFKRPVIDYSICTKCGLCFNNCKFDAISDDIVVKSGSCEGCSVCEYVCPVNAINMADYKIGELYTRRTKYGPMIDARLIPGEESSGKLVSEVRRLSKYVAKKEKKDFIIIDGSPGIACNVISTITGVEKAIIVTEPTKSGLHDLKRVFELSKIFNVKVDVAINKYDLNIDKSREIEEYCNDQGVKTLLHIPFDKRIVESISKLEIPSRSDIPYFTTNEWNDFIRSLQE